MYNNTNDYKSILLNHNNICCNKLNNKYYHTYNNIQNNTYNLLITNNPIN